MQILIRINSVVVESGGNNKEVRHYNESTAMQFKEAPVFYFAWILDVHFALDISTSYLKPGLGFTFDEDELCVDFLLISFYWK